jgi:DNA polymerase III delta' subunit
MSFSDIQDQNVPIRLLRNMLRSGRVPHGLLFWGPDGVGKGMTAHALARALNCKESEDDACGACLSCRKVDSGNHPDVKLITPSGRARLIGVDAVDTISELAAYRPFEGNWRIVIFEDAHRMGEPAQNHFLKTLEEPPSATLFVLISSSPRLLLPTIRSRCQSVRFGALRPETVARLLLKDHDLPEETAHALAVVSQGQMSRALDLVRSEKREAVLHVLDRLAKGEDPMAMGEEFSGHVKSEQELIRTALRGESDGPEQQELSREELEDIKKAQDAHIESFLRRDLMEYLYLMKTWYRDELVFSATEGKGAVLNSDRRDALSEISPAQTEKKLAAIDKAWLYIERNLNVDRVFRDLFFCLSS